MVKKYQLCYQDPGKNRLLVVLSLQQQKWDFVMKDIKENVVVGVIIKWEKFEAILNELKGQPPKESGHMVPFYKL